MNIILDQLDNFLASQKESEQKLFFFLPILLFGFLSYYFLYPITDESLTNSINKNRSLKTNIQNVQNTNNKLKTNIIKIQKVIKKEDKKIAVLKKNKEELDKLLKQLMFLKFDLNKWSNFYNNIPNIAKQNHLVIESLQNDLTLDNKIKLINKKMTLTINVTGNFVDFIKFMNRFESKKEVVKIRSINMTGNNLIVVIDIYGAEL